MVAALAFMVLSFSLLGRNRLHVTPPAGGAPSR
jgi:hypothetical protein